MGNHPNSIVTELYTRYYLENRTPESLVSSHWRFYQEKTTVKLANGKVQSLSGLGFGDLEPKSPLRHALSWLTIGSYLFQLPNRKDLLALMRIAVPLARRMGLNFSYDAFRQICALDLIIRSMQEKEKRLTVLNIGDGYVFLSALVKEVFKDCLICLVDLGRVLLFQAYYCGKAHPDCSHRLVQAPLNGISQSARGFLYCPAEYLDNLSELSFDLAINIASMQEMNQASIVRYFDFLRHHMSSDNLFYCCNREEKEMPGGEVSKFESYPWKEGDIQMIEEYCPWYRHFFSFSRARKSPYFFRMRIPFISYFDGPHRHRLTVLQTIT